MDIEKNYNEDNEILLDDDIFASLSESQMSFSLKENSIIESYRIIKEISRGNMGIVYLANDISLNRLCAIKVILSHNEGAYTILLKRFKKEAELCAELNHPNIVQIYSVGLYKEYPYIVMEYVEGVTLESYCREHCKENGEDDFELYAQLFIKIADALYNIHEHNIIHRDIKPSNILVRKNGEPVIMDFGIAKATNKESTLTKDNHVVGTLNFMSPEQVRGKRLDARSDLYSLGVMFYCILTHHFPFEETSTLNIMKNIATIPPINPSTFNSNIPDILQEIVLKSIEKKPEKRFESCKEFSKALKRYLNKTGKASITYKTIIKYRDTQEKIKNSLFRFAYILLIAVTIYCITNLIIYAFNKQYVFIDCNGFMKASSDAIKNAIAKKWDSSEIAEQYTWQEIMQKNTQYYIEKFYHILAQEYKALSKNNDNRDKYNKELKTYCLKLWKMQANNDFAEKLYEFLKEDVEYALERDFDKALKLDLVNIDELDLDKLEENRDKECQKIFNKEKILKGSLLSILHSVNNPELETKTIEENEIANPSLEQALMNVMVYLTQAEKWKRDEAIKRKADIYMLIIGKMAEEKIIPLIGDISQKKGDVSKEQKEKIVLYYINKQYIDYAEKYYYQYLLLQPNNSEILAKLIILLTGHDVIEMLQDRSVVTISNNADIKKVRESEKNNALVLYQKQCYRILQSYTKEMKETLDRLLTQRCKIIEQLNKNKQVIELYKRILQIQYRYLLAQFFIMQSDEYVAEIYNKSKMLKYTTSEEILKNILLDEKEEMIIRFLATNALNAMQTEEADKILEETIKAYEKQEYAIPALLAWIVASHRSDLLKNSNITLNAIYDKNFIYPEDALQLLYQFMNTDKLQPQEVAVLKSIQPTNSYTELLKISCLFNSNINNEIEDYTQRLLKIFEEYYTALEKNAENEEIQEKMIFCLHIMEEYGQYLYFQEKMKKLAQNPNKSVTIPAQIALKEINREAFFYLKIIKHINANQYNSIVRDIFTDSNKNFVSSSFFYEFNDCFYRNKLYKDIAIKLEDLETLTNSPNKKIQILALTMLKEIDKKRYKQIAENILKNTDKISIDTLSLLLTEFNEISDIIKGEDLKPKNIKLNTGEKCFIILKNFGRKNFLDENFLEFFMSKKVSPLKNMFLNRIPFMLGNPNFENSYKVLSLFIHQVTPKHPEQSGIIGMIMGLGTVDIEISKKYINQIARWCKHENHDVQRVSWFAYTTITERDKKLKEKHKLEPKTIMQKQGTYLGYSYNFYNQFQAEEKTEHNFVEHQQSFYIFMNKLYEKISKDNNNQDYFSSLEKALSLDIEVSEELTLQNAIANSLFKIKSKDKLKIKEGIKQLEKLRENNEKNESYQAYNYLIKKYLYEGYKKTDQKEKSEKLKNECLKLFPWDRDIRTDEKDYLENRFNNHNNSDEKKLINNQYNSYIRSNILPYLFNVAD